LLYIFVYAFSHFIITHPNFKPDHNPKFGAFLQPHHYLTVTIEYIFFEGMAADKSKNDGNV